MTEDKSSIFNFEGIEVREREYMLIKSGELVPVEPKAFRVLLYLLRHPKRLVTKDEIVSAVWENTAVSDNSLTRTVAVLRRSLGDESREPRYIATVHTIGYRFLCDVKVTEDHTGHPPQTDLAVDRHSATGQPSDSDIHDNSLEVVAAAQIPQSTRVGGRRYVLLAIAAALAMIVLALVAITLRLKVRPINVTESRLTRQPADLPVVSCAISPDGRYLAFTDRTGLYLRQLEGGETRNLAYAGDLSPVLVESWFPDSAHLLVSSWEGDPKKPRSLWKLSITGGTPLKLVDDGAQARVSPDGSYVALSRIRGGRTEIWLVHSDGEEAHQIVSGSASEEEHFGAVAWSPDSKSVAYVRATVPQKSAPETRIEALDIQSGKVSTVLSNPRLMGALAWIRSDSMIYTLVEDEPGGNDANLWEVQLDSRGSKARSNAIRLTSGRGLIPELSQTKDAKLALRRVDPQLDVYIAEFDNARKSISPPTRLTREDWMDETFSWTPDSKAILLLSDRDGRQHIFKQALDQAQPELLIGGDHDYGIPNYDPKGRDLLYLQMPKRDDVSQDVQIRRVPLAGGLSQLVLQAPGIWYHVCARHPSTLCVYSSGFYDQLRFFSFNSMTGKGAEIPSARMQDSESPNWNLSPDGRYLAFTRVKLGEDAAIRIISMSDDSEKAIPLTGWPVLSSIDWAADGKSFVLSACLEHTSPWGAPETCTMLNVDMSGKTTSLIEDRDVHYLAAIPSPDGKHLALIGDSASNCNVWLVKNLP
jgi:DNA-binding winged helix-turn-helix (wHTH) protein/Tol biopolymer transport system component